MWRDPLDELIDDLERVPDPRPAWGGLLPIEQLQQLTDAILYGSPGEVELLKMEPAYQEWISQSSKEHGPSDAGAATGVRSSLRSTVQYVQATLAADGARREIFRDSATPAVARNPRIGPSRKPLWTGI